MTTRSKGLDSETKAFWLNFIFSKVDFSKYSLEGFEDTDLEICTILLI